MMDKTFIVKTEAGYLEYNCITQRVMGNPVPLAEFKWAYLEKYSANRAKELEQRLARVDDHGTSSLDPKVTPASLGIL